MPQNALRRNQRTPHPTPPHTRPVGAFMAGNRHKLEPQPSLTHHLSVCIKCSCTQRRAIERRILQLALRYTNPGNSQTPPARKHFDPRLSVWLQHEQV